MEQNDLYTPKTKMRDRILIGGTLVVAALGVGVLLFPESGETPTTDIQERAEPNTPVTEDQTETAAEEEVAAQETEASASTEVEVNDDGTPNVHVN